MLPYPGIPYGKAPSWCFPAFEFGIYFLFIICLVYAYRQEKKEVTYLLGGLAFGLLLEYMEVTLGHYRYGRFYLMLGTAPRDIPVCIGVGWGIILYTSRLFSDRLGLSLWACAAVETFLALNIDLGMDMVAHRLHLWHWDWGHRYSPLTSQWFGTPYENFMGWQTVVFCYSVFSRLFERAILQSALNTFKFILVAVLALFSSIVVLYVTEAYIFYGLRKYLGILSAQRFIAIILILMAVVIYGWRAKVPSLLPPALSWWVPAWFHLFFTAAFFLLGFQKENEWMTTALVVNLLTGVVIHTLPFLHSKNENQSSF